ncbi:hypothetical protein T06_6798 [Trichinella sp. T6]|nr:hypothetical protein T06_6798 [Trichinella sp. T6]
MFEEIRVNEQKQKISGSLTNHGGKKMELYVFCKTCMMIVLLEWRTLNRDTAVIKKQLLMEKFKNQYCEEMLAIRAIDKQKKKAHNTVPDVYNKLHENFLALVLDIV